MKRWAIAVAVMVVSCTAFGQTKKDAVELATARNEAKSDRKEVDPAVAEFLVKAADARMMDIEEGDLASVKGSRLGIKNYGDAMIKDHTHMLKEIKSLAASRNVTLPAQISNSKKEGRDELAALSGQKFDRKFIRMMVIDHKRDLKMFRKAVDSSDEEISEFAELYIPVIQNHLARARALKKEF